MNTLNLGDTDKTRELTEDELNHVSGGKGNAPVKYIEYKLNDTLISSVAPSLYGERS